MSPKRTGLTSILAYAGLSQQFVGARLTIGYDLMMKSFTRAACLGTAMLTMGIYTVAQIQPVPPVYLTHVMFYVSGDTYEALKASALVRTEFGEFSEATIQAEAGALNYTGLYLFGMHTYLEIFKTRRSDLSHKVEMPGRLALAMWMDQRTKLPLILAQLPMAELQTRRDGQNHPWFDYIAEDPAKQEGVTSFITGFYPDGVVRSLPPYRPDRFLHDVIGCTATVGVSEREKLLRDFRAYGYTIREDGERVVASGPEFGLTLLPEPPGEPRTVSFKISLNREMKGDRSYRMGSSELQFDGKTATFLFRFPKALAN
jgi:hypothetical protein